MGSAKSPLGASAVGTAAAPNEPTATPLDLAGLLLIALPIWRDERGFFVERSPQPTALPLRPLRGRNPSWIEAARLAAKSAPMKVRYA